MSRKRVGQPISVTFTPEQAAWLRSKIEAGGTLTEVVRRIVDHAMRKETGKKKSSM